MDKKERGHTPDDNLFSKYNKKGDKPSSERRNPLNYTDKTLKWVKSTVKAAINKSECSAQQVLEAAEQGLKEIDRERRESR